MRFRDPESKLVSIGSTGGFAGQLLEMVHLTKSSPELGSITQNLNLYTTQFIGVVVHLQLPFKEVGAIYRKSFKNVAANF